MASDPKSAMPAETPDTVINKVGVALGQITQIRETYGERFASAGTNDEKQALEAEAQAVMVSAVREQGLSVEQFNAVVSAAESDADLGRRVLAAARAA